jgi:N-acetylglucosamine kinase-like BadF-type ATPase
MAKLIIGIDGGGTKTDCAVADLSGHVHHIATGKAANFLAIGSDQVVRNLFGLIEENLFKTEADFSDVEMILIGAAGAGRKEDANLLENKLNEYVTSEGVHLKLVKVVSDAEIALEGAFSGRPGCILIAGTCSILYAKDEKSTIHRIGGFGKAIGDEGSGYSIGKKALAAVGKQFDGRGDETLITNLLKKERDITSLDDLINKVYKENFDIASVAKLVIEAADLGDSIAEIILNEESNELLSHIKVIKNKFKSDKINVALIGSLIDNQNFYSNLLKNKIEMKLSYVEITEQENPPVVGAILTAKRILNEQS